MSALSSGQAYWTADTTSGLVEDSIGTVLHARSVEVPDRVALIGVGALDGQPHRLSYRDLYHRARQVAAALLEIAEPGSRVALWAPNVIEWPLVQYGAALAGVMLVALNPALRDSELDYALRHSKSGVLVHADRAGDRDMAAVAVRVGAAIPHLHMMSLGELGARAASAGPAELPVVDAAEVAMLQYTSGTTGDPKGVLLKHHSLINVARLTMLGAGIVDSSIVCNPLPMFHTAGCVIGTLGPLCVGATMVLIDGFEAGKVLAAITREGVDVLFYVPAMLAALTQARRGTPESGASLRVMLGGASEVAPELVGSATAAFGGTVLKVYGQTELAPVMAMTRPEDDASARLDTVGRPLPQVDCKIVNADTGSVCAVDEIGEICARGYQQFIAYLDDDAATARAVDADGFVRTGDLGFMDSRGYLNFTGRLKEMIDRGGENISPAEVEARLLMHDAVGACAVIGLPDERLHEVVAAVIVPARDAAVRGSATLARSLGDYAREHLAPQKVPTIWFVADELPVSGTGKVRRVAIRSAAISGQFARM